MRFTKLQGAGNDYVYVDCFQETITGDLAELARRISDRRRGVGSDGLILIWPTEQADARMQMLNADGSEAQMCGNGLRCVAKFVYDRGICRREELSLVTAAGLRKAWPIVDRGRDDDGRVDRVRIDMGPPALAPEEIPTTLVGDSIIDAPFEIAGQPLRVTCVSMGNPHCVIFVDDVERAPVQELGPQIETDPRFPERVNVEFVEVVSPSRVRQRTWERGSGETWACGTGAAAVGVAGVLTSRTERDVTVQLLGGDLEVNWSAADNHVYSTGPTVEVFTGHWPD